MKLVRRLIGPCIAAVILLVLPHAEAVTFSVSGTKILKDGQEYVIKGVNVNGPDWVWSRGSVQDADLIVNTWKFNTVRLNCGIGETRATENQDLAAVVNAFTSRGCVVQIEVHDFTGSYATATSTPTLSALRDWWVARANQFKTNPYVWFNIANENGAWLTPEWLTMQDTCIAAIRAAGASNIVVCDGADWATEGANGSEATIPTASSAILSYGPTLTSRYSNICFAIHIYHQWNMGGTAKMADFLDRCAAANLSVHIGEWGQSAFDPYESVTATTHMFNVVRSRKIGRIAWHWYPGDVNRLTNFRDSYTPGGGWSIDKTDGARPTNLSWMGELAWDDNRDQALSFDSLSAPLSRSGWTASAFSTYGTNTPALLLDGKYGDFSNWLSGAELADGQWFSVDMQAARTFNLVRISPQYDTFGPVGFKIYASNDPVNWGLPVATVLSGQTEQRISFPAQTKRYIKVETTGGLSWSGWWSVREFNVYNQTSGGGVTPPAGTGTGLAASYFNNTTLTGTAALTRTEAVDFDWVNGSPGTPITVDNFSARWTGQVEAPVTGSYTFTVTSDDGVRLWIGSTTGTAVIDKWIPQGPTSYSYVTSLTAGQKYDVKMEYYESGGGAVARLRWSYPGQGEQAIPASRLYSATPVTGLLPDGTYKVISRHSGKSMEVSANGTANGSNVQQGSYNAGENQKWTITHLGNNQYNLIGLQSGRALDVSGVSTADGANVHIWDYVGGNNQKWTLAATSGGYYSVIAVHSGKALDVAGVSTGDGANIHQWTYGAANNQQWAFQAP